MMNESGASPTIQIALGCVFVLVGFAMFPYAQIVDDDYGHNRQIREDAKQYPAETWGIIVDVQRNLGQAFTDSSGQQWATDYGLTAVIKYEVAGKGYEIRYGLPDPRTGDQMRVIYKPDDPSIAKPAIPRQLERPFRMPLIVCGIFVSALGLGAIARGIHCYRRKPV